MSKDKPEVGDVWRDRYRGEMVFITHTYGFYDNILGVNEKGSPVARTIDVFLNCWEYVNKVNIEDLFKTENE